MKNKNFKVGKMYYFWDLDFENNPINVCIARLKRIDYLRKEPLYSSSDNKLFCNCSNVPPKGFELPIDGEVFKRMAIIKALCRSSIANNPTNAQIRQIERLIESFNNSEMKKDADDILEMFEQTSDNKKIIQS